MMRGGSLSMRLNKRAIQELGGVVRASARQGGRDLKTTCLFTLDSRVQVPGIAGSDRERLSHVRKNSRRRSYRAQHCYSAER